VIAPVAGRRDVAGATRPERGGVGIRLEGLRLSYRDREVLHGIDLEIRAGERVALVGPNGAGKSSLLRCVTGVARQPAGRALLGGTPVDALSRPAMARRIAVVPGQATIPFAARVEEVVALGRLPHEHPFLGPREPDRAAVARAIARVGIEHLAGRDARELSLGEQQLVMLAMALAQETPCLVLDEPTVHLDLRHQVATMRLLVDLNERDGVTVLAVLHDIGLASHFFPRVVVLDAGRVAADGPPSDALAPDVVRRIFGVDPALVRIGSGTGDGTI
jgi:iron complex transport system ATP-binding protein